jgi:hypothetical protein
VVPFDENMCLSSSEWGVDDVQTPAGTESPPLLNSSDESTPSPTPPSISSPISVSTGYEEYHVPIQPIYRFSSSPIQETDNNNDTTYDLSTLKLINEHIAISSEDWANELLHDPIETGTIQPAVLDDERDDNTIGELSLSSSATLTQPTDGDILCGRGGFTNSHPGNRQFRLMALELRPMYEACETKNEKYDISNLLVECVVNKGYRFLKRNSEGSWVELDWNAARKKASQQLRERIKSASTIVEFQEVSRMRMPPVNASPCSISN